VSGERVEYLVIVHHAEEGGFWSEVPALSGAGSQGESVDQTIENTKESIEAIIQTMKDRGERIRPPDDVVVNVQVAV
jgi:predicted RNase H-like HicB family nuclease